MVDQTEKHIVSDSDEISLKDLILKVQEWWRFLLSKWLAILCAGIIGGLIGLAYSWTKKPIYKAELSFALQDEKASNGLGGAIGLASQFGIDLGGSAGGEFAGDNLLELMKSRSMMTRALLTPVVINNKPQTLAEYYIDFNELRKDWKENPQLANIHFLPGADISKFSLKQDSILGVFHATLLKKNLKVDKADKKLSIITVTVNSIDELFSKYFAEILTKVVSDFYTQTKTEKAAKNVAILEKQTDSVRRMLNGAITGVAASTDVNPNPNPFLATLRVPSQHKQVDVQANTAILSQLVTNKEIAKMTLLQSTPLIQLIDRPILPLEIERLGRAKALIVGGLIGAFLMTIWLLVKRFYKKVMATAGRIDSVVTYN